MKTKLIMAVTAATAIFTSCQKEEVLNAENTNEVAISFIAEDASTKSFFDPTNYTEPWESTLSSLSVLVFDNGGNLIVHRNFNSSEVAGKSASFALPNTAAGATCEFYAVANITVPVTVKNRDGLLAMLESDPALYNSTFAQASIAAVRSGGFVMSGKTTKTIAPVASKTDVAITLFRTVAKIAIQTAITPEFTTRYYGKIRVNSAIISKSANQTNIVTPEIINSGVRNFSYTQVPNQSAETFQNLYYLFENSVIAAGERVMLTLDTTYDRDGNFATTSDQAPVVYNIELSGAGSGEFNRNSYYRIIVNLDGLTGADATAAISVAPWSSPVTQTVNLGQ